MEEYRPNYRNIIRKSKNKTKKRVIILIALLATSLSLNAAIGVKKVYEEAKDSHEYMDEVNNFNAVVARNTFRTNDGSQPFINTFSLAVDVRNLEVTDRDEFYHHLISIVQNIMYEKHTNFDNLIKDLDLDELAQSNSIYPTVQEFYEFLENANLLNENGSINFEAWEKYDKEVYTMKNDIQELKEAGVKK